MAKVTGKFQITLPKALVDQCGIRVGDELELKSIGQAIQIDRRNTVDATRARHERLNRSATLPPTGSLGSMRICGPTRNDLASTRSGPKTSRTAGSTAASEHAIRCRRVSVTGVTQNVT